MKLLLLTLLVHFGLSASSQTEARIFYGQLMVVFSDLDQGFPFLKGDLKDAEALDSLFESTMALEGTTDNTILSSRGVHAYQAMISDSTTGEGGALIMKAWKKKLDDALAGSFPPPSSEFRSPDKGITGYQYTSGKTRVLLLQHKTEAGWCWINLVIQSK